MKTSVHLRWYLDNVFFDWDVLGKVVEKIKTQLTAKNFSPLPPSRNFMK